MCSNKLHMDTYTTTYKSTHTHHYTYFTDRHTCTRAHTYVCTYTHGHTLTHTHIRTHTHTQGYIYANNKYNNYGICIIIFSLCQALS